MKMCEQIFKKKTASQYNSNSSNFKKPRTPQYSSAQLAAIKNTYYLTNTTTYLTIQMCQRPKIENVARKFSDDTLYQ